MGDNSEAINLSLLNFRWTLFFFVKFMDPNSEVTQLNEYHIISLIIFRTSSYQTLWSAAICTGAIENTGAVGNSLGS